MQIALIRSSRALLAIDGLYSVVWLGESRMRWVVYISPSIRVLLCRFGLVSSLAPAGGGAVIVLVAVVFAVLCIQACYHLRPPSVRLWASVHLPATPWPCRALVWLLLMRSLWCLAGVLLSLLYLRRQSSSSQHRSCEVCVPT